MIERLKVKRITCGPQIELDWSPILELKLLKSSTFVAVLLCMIIDYNKFFVRLTRVECKLKADLVFFIDSTQEKGVFSTICTARDLRIFEVNIFLAVFHFVVFQESSSAVELCHQKRSIFFKHF